METRPYGRPLSTVFGYTDKAMAFDADDDFDPLLSELRILSYRYVRLFFHPVKDLFVLTNGWKDPAWTDVRAARSGVDAEDKGTREAVFGPNLVDIEQKSIPKLLVDEVRHRPWPTPITAIVPVLTPLGSASVLCLPGRQLDPLVPRPVLLLCHLHLHNVRGQYSDYPRRNSCSKSYPVSLSVESCSGS